MDYLWLKALHVTAVLVWMSGLLAVALGATSAAKVSSSAEGRSALIERTLRWDQRVTLPAMLLAWGGGGYARDFGRVVSLALADRQDRDRRAALGAACYSFGNTAQARICRCGVPAVLAGSRAAADCRRCHRDCGPGRRQAVLITSVEWRRRQRAEAPNRDVPLPEARFRSASSGRCASCCPQWPRPA